MLARAVYLYVAFRSNEMNKPLCVCVCGGGVIHEIFSGLEVSPLLLTL